MGVLLILAATTMVLQLSTSDGAFSAAYAGAGQGFPQMAFVQPSFPAHPFNIFNGFPHNVFNGFPGQTFTAIKGTNDPNYHAVMVSSSNVGGVGQTSLYVNNGGEEFEKTFSNKRV